MEASRWPVDYDALKQGDQIPVEQVERILRVSRDHANYPLKLLSFKETIQQELIRRERVWTVRTIDGAIRILTDAEASPYNDDELCRGVRIIYRRHALTLGVNRGNLNEEQCKEHDHRIKRQAFYINSLNAAKKEIRAMAHQRSTPEPPGLMAG